MGGDDEIHGVGAFLAPESDEGGVCGRGFDRQDIDSGAKEFPVYEDGCQGIEVDHSAA